MLKRLSILLFSILFIAPTFANNCAKGESIFTVTLFSAFSGYRILPPDTGFTDKCSSADNCSFNACNEVGSLTVRMGTAASGKNPNEYCDIKIALPEDSQGKASLPKAVCYKADENGQSQKTTDIRVSNFQFSHEDGDSKYYTFTIW